MSHLSSSTNTHIFRSLSSDSQKKDWTKRLSLRGLRHHASGNSPSSAKDVRWKMKCCFCHFLKTFFFRFLFHFFNFSGNEKAQIFQSFFVAKTIHKHRSTTFSRLNCYRPDKQHNSAIKFSAAIDTKEI